MVAFTLRAIHSGGAFTHSFGISDLTSGMVQGQFMLYSASQADGGLAAFRLTAGQAATFVSEVAGSAATGTMGVEDIAIASIGSTPVLVSAGRYDDAFAYRLFSSNGNFGTVANPPPSGVSTAALTAIETVTIGSSNYMIAGRDNGAGLSVFSMTAGYGLGHVSTLSDSVAATLANVSDLATFKTATTNLVFATSSLEHGVTSMSIDQNGNLTVVDSISGLKGYGIYQATQVATVTAGNADFLLVGASGSSNISVFEIGSTGDLSFRDMVWDTLNTRFRQVTALESFEFNNRAFVLAGGTDGGMTLYELSPNGKLYFLTNAIDTYTTTLASISSIDIAIVGNDIQVFVASATESGITQFSLSLGTIGNLVAPSGPSTGAVGSPGDDFIMGTDDRNSLWGLNGNDRIVDGGGIDHLYGGLGADIFVFIRDGMDDRVMDYQPGIDKIDLSDFPMIYSMAALQIETTVSGARIRIGSEVISLETMNGQSLTAADFSEASFIF